MKSIKNLVYKISRYSPIFYLIVIGSLLFFQSDIFKDTFPNEYIVDGIIVISSFAFSSIAIDKLFNKSQSKPYIICQMCDSKMRCDGKWICENRKCDYYLDRNNK